MLYNFGVTFIGPHTIVILCTNNMTIETESNEIEPPSSNVHNENSELVVENITKRFGGLKAVDGLSFRVKNQEILGLIGPNGAGKTTVFNCIMGDLIPNSGEIRFNGKPLNGLKTEQIVKRGINRTFQSFAPLEDRSVIRNVELSLVSDDLFPIRDRGDNYSQEAIEICKRVGLDEDLESRPHELPHAGLIRLELARAIGTNPEVLLIDEAFAGLSKLEVNELSSLLESLRSEGTSLIVIDHNMHGLLDLVNRVIVIQFGSKIAEGSPDEIISDSEVQDAYLGKSKL